MPSLPLTGRTVLVTGTITGLTRDEAKNAVTALGGSPAASVTGKVDLIVLGEGAGVSKEAKARSLRIAALDGDTFAALVADPDSWDGTPVGMPFADYDALHEIASTEPLVASDPAHLVGLVSLSVRDPNAACGFEHQNRCSCTCGHKWLSKGNTGRLPECPRPATPATAAPWSLT